MSLLKKLLPLMLAAVLCLISRAVLADILINEIMADNGDYDKDGNAYDWIELFNSGKDQVDLSGWGLTESKTDLYAFTFPQGTVLKGGEFAFVYCCGTDVHANVPKSRIYYAPYKLSSSGETIRLTDRDGAEQAQLKYPEQIGGHSYGIPEGGTEYGFFETATPRKKNGKTVYQAITDRPLITTPAGFSASPVTIEITSQYPVRYTLDGSAPTAKSKLYEQPVTITKTTVVRARAFGEGMLPSYVTTSSYIINDPAITPVMSFATDKAYLTGKQGLFQKPNYNTDQEYPIHIEYFDENGVRQINEAGSFHIVGTSTRAQKQKSFAIYPRSAFGGGSYFEYNPFETRSYQSYRAFTVRSTGSDAPYCRMKDVVLTSLAEGLDIMYLAGKTVVCYINGAYYGQYNIREKINKYSIAQWEGVTDKDLIDRIDIIKGEARDDQIQNGSADDWRELRAFVKANDLNVPENLQYVTDRLDVDSLFTWTSFELCIMNQDLENVRVYRVPGGKWKYILYDVESGGDVRDNAVYMLLDSSKAGKAISSHYSLIKNLLKVPQMRERFLTRLAEVIEHSFLYTKHVKPVIDKNEALLKQLLPRHFQLYKNNKLSTWKTNVTAFRRGMRAIPRRMLTLVFEAVKVTEAEQETYFGQVLRDLEVYNAKGSE